MRFRPTDSTLHEGDFQWDGYSDQSLLACRPYQVAPCPGHATTEACSSGNDIANTRLPERVIDAEASANPPGTGTPLVRSIG